MLFVRCGGGIRNNPAESLTAADAQIAANTLLDFIELIDPAKLTAAS